MTKFRNILMFIVVVAASCHRQPVYDPEFLNALIPITLDWSESNVNEDDINNVSVYLYPTDGGAPIICYSDNLYYAEANAPAGDYNVIIHNEMTDNIKGVIFSQVESYDSFSFMGNKSVVSQADMFYEPTASQQHIDECESFAAWKYERFKITNEMVAYTRTRSFEKLAKDMRSVAESRSKSRSASDEDSTKSSMAISYSDNTQITESLDIFSDIKPQPRSLILNIKVSVINFNSAQYAEGILRNLTDGVVISSGAGILPDADVENYNHFVFTDYSYTDSSETDGRLMYRHTSVGIDTSDDTKRHIFTINFLLHTGEEFRADIDITDQIKSANGELIIDINIGDEYNNGTQSVMLPESSDGGFGVTDWGVAKDVEL